MAPSTQTPTRRPKTRLWVAAGLGVMLIGAVIACWPALGTLMAQSAATPTPAPVDGARAYGYLLDLCKIGPRPAGSEANTRQRKLVAEHFKKLGATVREQPFEGADPI